MNIIEAHNKMYECIWRVKDYMSASEAWNELNMFCNQYQSIDAGMCSRLREKFAGKVKELVSNNEETFQSVNEKLTKNKNNTYDFSVEKDLSLAVQQRSMQLIAELPSNLDKGNESFVDNQIQNVINSGVIGSRAVLELLKYPTYKDYVSVTNKSKAFEGSKTASQKEFENNQSKINNRLSKQLSDVYKEGFMLRRLNEKVTGTPVLH